MEKNNEINSAKGGAQSKVIETYAEDMAKVLENDNTGLVKKIIHEEEAHEVEKKKNSPQSAKNKLFMIFSIVFIIAGFVTLFYFIFANNIPSVQIEKQFTPLIYSDMSTSLDVTGLDKDKVIQTISDAVKNTKVKLGGMEGLYPVISKQSVGLRDFMQLIKGNFAPGSEMGATSLLVSDNFLMGVVNNNTKDFFMLIKIRSIADIFSSLRSWEKKMFADLSKFIGVEINSDTKYLLTKEFQDGIVENKNARILYDNDGKIVLMYIFVNENSIVVTNTKESAHEIMLRIATNKIEK